jgi:hypothetical protein
MRKLRKVRMRRAGWLLVTVGLLAAMSCGAVPRNAEGDASTRKMASPPPPSPNLLLAASNCTEGAAGLNSTLTKSLGMDSITLKIPPNWSDQTAQVTGVSALLRIQAPANYGPDNATFELDTIPGPRPGSSAHEQAIEDAAGLVAVGPQSGVNDCTVGGEVSSFYQYRDSAGHQVYRLFVLHSPTSRYPFLYVAEIASEGPIDSQAATDIRGILASWTWGKPIYDPND